MDHSARAGGAAQLAAVARGVVVTLIQHSKTAPIDGVWATVGSTSLDWRSWL